MSHQTDFCSIIEENRMLADFYITVGNFRFFRILDFYIVVGFKMI